MGFKSLYLLVVFFAGLGNAVRRVGGRQVTMAQGVGTAFGAGLTLLLHI